MLSTARPRAPHEQGYLYRRDDQTAAESEEERAELSVENTIDNALITSVVTPRECIVTERQTGRQTGREQERATEASESRQAQKHLLPVSEMLQLSLDSCEFLKTAPAKSVKTMSISSVRGAGGNALIWAIRSDTRNGSQHLCQHCSGSCWKEAPGYTEHQQLMKL